MSDITLKDLLEILQKMTPDELEQSIVMTDGSGSELYGETFERDDQNNFYIRGY
jgi:hypothetical protein